ncbi:MAG: sugar dehydrogenase, partial [Desulfofustis sp.]|nr:sugar dehydrogenase [Desulfofustis sp.]
MPKCPAIQLLKGQKAMVTGANSGIGRAVAVALG